MPRRVSIKRTKRKNPCTNESVLADVRETHDALANENRSFPDLLSYCFRCGACVLCAWLTACMSKTHIGNVHTIGGHDVLPFAREVGRLLDVRAQPRMHCACSRLCGRPNERREFKWFNFSCDASRAANISAYGR